MLLFFFLSARDIEAVVFLRWLGFWEKLIL